MIQDAVWTFAERAKICADNAGDLKVADLIRFMAEHHGNVSWFATLNDLVVLVNEMTGSEQQ